MNNIVIFTKTRFRLHCYAGHPAIVEKIEECAEAQILVYATESYGAALAFGLCETLEDFKISRRAHESAGPIDLFIVNRPEEEKTILRALRDPALFGGAYAQTPLVVVSPLLDRNDLREMFGEIPERLSLVRPWSAASWSGDKPAFRSEDDLDPFISACLGGIKLKRESLPETPLPCGAKGYVNSLGLFQTIRPFFPEPIGRPGLTGRASMRPEGPACSG